MLEETRTIVMITSDSVTLIWHNADLVAVMIAQVMLYHWQKRRSLDWCKTTDGQFQSVRHEPSLDVDQQQQQQLNVNIKGRSGLPLLDHRLSRVGRSEATKSDRLSVICALVKDTRTDLNGVGMHHRRSELERRKNL